MSLFTRTFRRAVCAVESAPVVESSPPVPDMVPAGMFPAEEGLWVGPRQAPPVWVERLKELQAERNMDSAGLIEAMRDHTGNQLRADERMRSLFFAWETGRTVPTEYYRGLLGKVFEVDPAEFTVEGPPGPAEDTPASSNAAASGLGADPYREQGSRPVWAKRLTALRREQGMSKADLLEALREHGNERIGRDEGIFRVIRWESGKQAPSAYFRDLFGEIFGVSPAEFEAEVSAATDAEAEAVRDLPAAVAADEDGWEL